MPDKFRLVFLLLVEPFQRRTTPKFWHQSFIESRSILGFIFDTGGSAVHTTRGMHVHFFVNRKPVQMILRWNSSDFRVFEQVVIKEEYRELVSLLPPAHTVGHIIDAGANVGCTSLYLAAFYPRANIVALEIDQKNFSALVENVQLNHEVSIECVRQALWFENTKVNSSRDHLDLRDWSAKVTTDGSADIDASTLSHFMETMRWDSIDILKMDIEGAEAEIFEKDHTLDVALAKTRCIAMEVHTDQTAKFEKRLRSQGFLLRQINETFFAHRN